jgi:acetyl-CoA acetyltransferase
MEVAAGLADIVLVVGVDKPMPVGRAEALARIGSLADDAIAPVTHFALLADAYAARTGAKLEDIALVALKNHHNGSKNPYAQHQKERTLGGRPEASRQDPGPRRSRPRLSRPQPEGLR